MRAVTFLLALWVAASLASVVPAQVQSTNPAILAPAPTATPPSPQPTTLSASQRAAITAELKSKWQAAANARPGGGVRWARLLTEAVATADADYVLRATTAKTLDELHKALAGGDIREKAAPSASPSTSPGNGVGSQATLGSSYISDLVYTPLPYGRCRIYDTRNLGARLVGVRNLEIEAKADYASQGGTGTVANGTGSANCGIPLYSGAYALSVTLMSSAANGFVKTFEYGKTQPTGNTIWMNGGSSGSTGDVTVKSCIGCAYEIGIGASSAVHVMVDVIGFYRYAILPTPFTPYCYSTADGSTPLAANGWGDAYAPACASGYTRMSTVCWMGHYTANLAGALEGRCYGSTGNYASSVNARNYCCRVAGR